MKIKNLLVIVIITIILFISCYSYVPNLKNLSPEEVVFEFNRILNRIEEIEYLKGILKITTGKAHKDAEKLVNIIILYNNNSKNISIVKEEIETLIEYYKRLKIVVIDKTFNDNNTILINASYYDNKTQNSDIKEIHMIKNRDIWKISDIIDIDDKQQD